MTGQCSWSDLRVWSFLVMWHEVGRECRGRIGRCDMTLGQSPIMRSREGVAWLCDRTLAAEWNRMRRAHVSSRVTYAEEGRHAKPERIGCTRASGHVRANVSGRHFPSLDAYWIRPNPEGAVSGGFIGA
jgi:hypothetical protein